MIRAIQIAFIAMMLSVAVLGVFGCFAIRDFMKGVAVLTADSDAALKAATAAEIKAAAVADNLNGLVNESRPQIAATLLNVNTATGNLRLVTAGLNRSVAELNAPCVPGPCGTLADVNRTLGSIRLASGQVTAFSLKEQTQLDRVNRQETAVAGLTQADLAKLGMAIDGINALATNSDLTGSLKQTNVALGAVAGMATDTEQYWHATLHPKWPKRIWNAVTGVGINVAKFFW